MAVNNLSTRYDHVAVHLITFVCPPFVRGDDRLSRFFKTAEDCFNTRFTHVGQKQADVVLRTSPDVKIFDTIDFKPLGRVPTISNGFLGSEKRVIQFEAFSGFDKEVLSHILTISVYTQMSDEQLLKAEKKLVAVSEAYCVGQSSPRMNVEKVVRPVFAVSAYENERYIYGGLFTDRVYLGKSTSENYQVDISTVKKYPEFVSEFLGGYFIDRFAHAQSSEGESASEFEIWFKNIFAFSQLGVALEKARVANRSSRLLSVQHTSMQ